jgi:hypothetical protein
MRWTALRIITRWFNTLFGNPRANLLDLTHLISIGTSARQRPHGER